jgi:ATP-dependent Clp protease ATP-binding subunit ClpB
MTSNLGSHIIQEKAGKATYDEMKADVMEVVGGHFRPEFINRIDDIVVFHPLDKAQIRAITEIQLKGLMSRLAESEVSLQIDKSVLDVLGNAGFDPLFGARPLKRVIQQRIENPLAQKILRGDYPAGSKVSIELVNDEIQFN